MKFVEKSIKTPNQRSKRFIFQTREATTVFQYLYLLTLLKEELTPFNLFRSTVIKFNLYVVTFYK